jgi:hypothetical protein
MAMNFAPLDCPCQGASSESLDSSFQCAQVSIAALAESSISGGTSVSLLEEIFENYSCLSVKIRYLFINLISVTTMTTSPPSFINVV